MYVLWSIGIDCYYYNTHRTRKIETHYPLEEDHYLTAHDNVIEKNTIDNENNEKLSFLCTFAIHHSVDILVDYYGGQCLNIVKL